MTEKQKDLCVYRLKQAEETVQSAKLCFFDMSRLPKKQGWQAAGLTKRNINSQKENL